MLANSKTSLWQKCPDRIHLKDTDIHIWKGHIPSFLIRANALMANLSMDEKMRAERFRFNCDKERYSICRGLLREVLGRYLQVTPNSIELSYNKFGKPNLNDSDAIRFNISHSKDYLAIALSRHLELGIDIEWKKPDRSLNSLARHSFSEREATEIAKDPNTLDSFFRCWTRKEAFIKARGLGLAIELDSFTVSVRDSIHAEALPPINSQFKLDDHTIYHIDFENPEYAAALAVRGKAESIVCYVAA